MNPFNLLINYVIANSRASFYNVPGNQEITNTALLTGMVSENPLMSYLIIDNKAKIEGEKFSSTTAPVPVVRATTESPGLPPGTVINPPADTSVPPKGTETSTSTNQSAEIITMEAVKTEIATANKVLEEEIAKSLESNHAEITKIIAEKLDSKIAFLEKSNITLNDSILEIKKRLDEISKANQTLDASVENKNAVLQKAPTKPNTK